MQAVKRAKLSRSNEVRTIRVSGWVVLNKGQPIIRPLTQAVLTSFGYNLIIRALLPRRKSPFSALRVSTTSGASSITRA